MQRREIYRRNAVWTLKTSRTLPVTGRCGLLSVTRRADAFTSLDLAVRDANRVSPV